MVIRNDSDFKDALNKLSVVEQRQIAARFSEGVLSLCKDRRVAAAVHAALRTDITDDELTVLYQAARTACVDSYTQCGHVTDWLNQAGHFVAEAATACVMPAERGANLAWDAAMRARMARTCEAIATGQGTENREAAHQYSLLTGYLNK
jgi:hypothetical protein